MDPTAFGCLHVGAHQAFADEIGAAMAAAALSHTGFSPSSPRRISGRAVFLLPRRPAHGTRGRVVVQVVRGAETVLRRTNDVDAAVAYLRDVRIGAFVRSFRAERTHTPRGRTRPRLCNASVTHSVAENKSSLVVAFRRSNKPGAIDDEKALRR